MLVSESATTAIRNMVERQDAADTTGLRIAGDPAGTGQLSVSAAGLPEEGDQVVEAHGARVYLEPAAASVLDDKVFEATVDEQGRLSFLIHSQ